MSIRREVVSCLHWSLVNEHSIELFGGFGSQAGLVEGNVGNTTALTVLVVL
jgi:hypothetical protein